MSGGQNGQRTAERKGLFENTTIVERHITDLPVTNPEGQVMV